MVPAGYPALLGSPEGNCHIGPGEKATLVQLAATAEKYNVPVSTTVCQYASFTRALVAAAIELEASAVY